MDNKTFIIAEMSANHCGQLDLAKKIITAAQEAGANAVKIQTYTADTLTIDCHADDFKISGAKLWEGRYLYDLYKEAATPWEWQRELKEFADSRGIMLFSTPFDNTAVDFLESLDVKAYKIASFEAIDLPLVRYAASKGKPMIISTGICSLEEIEEAVQTCFQANNRDVTLLKCTSSYPASLEEMNLRVIEDLQKRFGPRGVKIGLSDHSRSLLPPVMAVTLGATVIEKHFTLDRKLGGPDAEFSFEPEEFARMVQDVRLAEKAMGDVSYAVNEKNRRLARSLYAVEDIAVGDVFGPHNVRSIRPGYGLHPRYYDTLMGQTAKRNISRGNPLREDDLAVLTK